MLIDKPQTGAADNRILADLRRGGIGNNFQAFAASRSGDAKRRETPMIRTSLSALAVLALLATPSLAAHCPLDAEAIDHALAARADLPEGERAEIQALRDQGMEQHEAGDHSASEATLAEAMRRLLLAE